MFLFLGSSSRFFLLRLMLWEEIWRKLYNVTSGVFLIPKKAKWGWEFIIIFTHIFLSSLKKKKEKNLRKFLHNEKCNKRLFSQLVKMAENPYKKLELLLQNYCWYVYYSLIDPNDQTDWLKNAITYQRESMFNSGSICNNLK